VRRGLIIILAIIVLLALPGARQPVQAAIFSGPDGAFNLAMFSLGTIGASSIAYYVYKNSPGQRSKGYAEELGPGEWFLGGYTGLSYLPPADWKFAKEWPPGIEGRTAKNITYDPGVLGGVKMGRYFDTIPWLGVGMETSFSRNAIRGSNGRISPPLPTGATRLFTGADYFDIWAMQVNLLMRYGFFKDKEVTFGRLQPYVGIGPGFELVYATIDSSKNFALEVQAGLRYMCTEKIALFCEYKFSYQFQVEYQNFAIAKQSPESQGKGPSLQTMTFDLPQHRFVLGISYHFKNLFGN
jgi:opacity protein-like surface antigen